MASVQDGQGDVWLEVPESLRVRNFLLVLQSLAVSRICSELTGGRAVRLRSFKRSTNLATSYKPGLVKVNLIVQMYDPGSVLEPPKEVPRRQTRDVLGPWLV